MESGEYDFMKRDTSKQKKPIFKKWWFWVIIVVIAIAAFRGGNSSKDKDQEDKAPDTTETPVVEENTEETEEVIGEETNEETHENEESKQTEKDIDEKRVDEFCNKIEASINDPANIALDEGMYVTDVSLSEGEVTVVIDLSNLPNNPSATTKKTIAAGTFYNVSNAFLDVEGNDDLWDTFTVKFIDIGIITKTKSDVKDDGLGRYFDYGFDDWE